MQHFSFTSHKKSFRCKEKPPNLWNPSTWSWASWPNSLFYNKVYKIAYICKKNRMLTQKIHSVNGKQDCMWKVYLNKLLKIWLRDVHPLVHELFSASILLGNDKIILVQHMLHCSAKTMDHGNQLAMNSKWCKITDFLGVVPHNIWENFLLKFALICTSSLIMKLF